MASSTLRSRWAAIGAAVAVCLGAGGVGISHAVPSSGEQLVYTPITPCRLADTRPAPDTVGPRTSPLGAGEIYTLDGWGTIGNCTLLSNTSALALNVTAVNPTQLTYLTLWAADSTQPVTSNLNPAPGQPPTPNTVTVNLSSTGQFKVFNELGSVDVIIDVAGYYDDHDHDDRYYQKSEVNAAVAGARTLAVYLSGEQNTALSATDTPVRTLSLTAPSAGTVLVNSSVDLDQTGPGVMGGRCSITTGTGHDFAHLQLSFVAVGQQQTLSGTRGFDVGAGAFTVNLLCDVYQGTGSARDSSLTAIFVPD